MSLKCLKYAVLLITYTQLMIVLRWPKTEALFDVRSIDHFITGISVWALAIWWINKIFKKYKLKSELEWMNEWFPVYKFILASFVVLFLAYAWETLEHYLEVGIAGERLKYWFQWVEYWPNRLIFDPLLVYLWFVVASKYPKVVLPARIFTTTWLLLHLLVFPNSMYLQYLIWWHKAYWFSF